MQNPEQPAHSILVVDDTPANLHVLIKLLSEQGYRVRPAPSGPLAITAAQATPPDLILLDIMMPGMNGYEVCARLKADERTREIPVIFLSALDETFNKVQAFAAGGVDYITKPFQAEEVLARIKTHITLYRLQRQQRELFQRFATKEVVDELMEHGFALGGAAIEATMLFADIRSFTSITEAQSPAETISFLNRYFAAMVAAIGSEGGIINHLAGDGLMAIFGAPVPRRDHSRRAVGAALKMLAQVELLNQEQARLGQRPIRIGVGIAAGPVVAGFVGAEMRATYTCVGDVVNTAARLEAATKELGHPIVIDGRTRAALDGAVETIDQGELALRGKTQPVRAFAIPAAAALLAASQA